MMKDRIQCKSCVHYWAAAVAVPGHIARVEGWIEKAPCHKGHKSVFGNYVHGEVKRECQDFEARGP